MTNILMEALRALNGKEAKLNEEINWNLGINELVSEILKLFKTTTEYTEDTLLSYGGRISEPFINAKKCWDIEDFGIIIEENDGSLLYPYFYGWPDVRYLDYRDINDYADEMSIHIDNELIETLRKLPEFPIEKVLSQVKDDIQKVKDCWNEDRDYISDEYNLDQTCKLILDYFPVDSIVEWYYFRDEDGVKLHIETTYDDGKDYYESDYKLYEVEEDQDFVYDESLNESVEDVNSIIDDFKQGFEDPKIRARSYPNGIFVFLDFVNDKEKYLRLNEVNGQYEAYWFETKTTWEDVKSEEQIIGKFNSFEEMIKYLADNKWFTDDSEITLDDAITFLNK